jgi:hypothetical protein
MKEEEKMKEFTKTQLRILLSDRSARIETAIGHGAELDATHETILIPIFKSGEHKSSNAMEKKGWGYVTVCAPHDYYFFRPVNDLVAEAVQAVREMPSYVRAY